MRYIEKYRFCDNFVDIVIISIFNTALADFDIYRNGDNYRNIEEYFDKSHLVCDCAITLEMKVGSVLSSHLKKSYRNFDIYPNIVSISYQNKNPDIAHH